MKEAHAVLFKIERVHAEQVFSERYFLHRHGETEVFRILEGRYLFEVNGRRFEAEAGEVISVPGGDVHTFLNITDQPAHQLVMILPGMDAQAFFVGLGEVFAKGKPDREALSVFGKPWGVEFLGPPLLWG